MGIRADLTGALLGFAGLLVVGAGVQQHSPALRSGGLAIISLGIALSGLDALARGVLRYGRHLSSSYVGIGARLRGASMIIIASAFAFAAWRELVAPGMLQRDAASTTGFATMAIFGGGAAFWYGAALVLGTSEGRESIEGWLSIPSRIGGFLLTLIALAAMAGGTMQIWMPAALHGWLGR